MYKILSSRGNSILCRDQIHLSECTYFIIYKILIDSIMAILKVVSCREISLKQESQYSALCVKGQFNKLNLKLSRTTMVCMINV